MEGGRMSDDDDDTENHGTFEDYAVRYNRGYDAGHLGFLPSDHIKLMDDDDAYASGFAEGKIDLREDGYDELPEGLQ